MSNICYNILIFGFFPPGVNRNFPKIEKNYLSDHKDKKTGFPSLFFSSGGADALSRL